MIKNLKKKKGFTLIELIIVIAILGILAAIAIPKFTNVQVDAKIKGDVSNAKIIADATSMAYSKDKITGTYTTKAEPGTDISGELQTDIPAPKALTGVYKVQIDSNGNITVFITTTAAQSVKGTSYAAGDYEVYPTPVSPFTFN